MLDDFDMDFPEEEDDFDEEESSEEDSNRTFMMVAGGLGALIIIGLICVAIYMFVIRPRMGGGQQAAQQTETAIALSVANEVAQTETALAAIPTMTDTPVPSDTPVPTDTPEPTDTLAAIVTAEDGTGGGPTQDPRTATVQALLTQAALAQTQAAQQLLTQTATPTPTGLPDTGIMDDLGAPTLFGMAALLIVVIFIARRLRAVNG